MPTLQPKDLIAGITILAMLLLKLKGIDAGFDTALALILGYYFVKRQNGQDCGK